MSTLNFYESEIATLRARILLEPRAPVRRQLAEQIAVIERQATRLRDHIERRGKNE